jgi:starvation-inducible DNA-binding protein
MQMNTCINESDRKIIAGELSKLLADSYTLYLKTHNFHWNVTGPMFQTLHLMFEAQYNELALSVDKIAERIRALGVFAPATYAEFQKLSSIKEPVGNLHFRDMIHQLVEGHEAVIKTARSAFLEVKKSSDEATGDLLSRRIQHHEKTAWMLRSLLAG